MNVKRRVDKKRMTLYVGRNREMCHKKVLKCHHIKRG